MATQSRPDIAYATCYASSAYADGTIGDLKLVNRTIKFLKANPLKIRFPTMIAKTHLFLFFSDASFGNLHDAKSQGGHIVFAVDPSGNCCPLTWQNKKIKRVCKSTLASESWAMVEAIESAELVIKQHCELFKSTSTNMICITDCKSLYDVIHTTNTLEDKGLCIPLACLRQRVTQEEMSVRWVSTTYQLADCLTNAGASVSRLREVLATGKFEHEILDIVFEN